MTTDIHHEAARFESEESARQLLQSHAVAIQLTNGEVVVGGPAEREDSEQ